MNLSESKDNSRTELWFSLWIFFIFLAAIKFCIYVFLSSGGRMDKLAWLVVGHYRKNESLYFTVQFHFPISYT